MKLGKIKDIKKCTTGKVVHSVFGKFKS